jgi:hypothetical protein
MKYSFDSECLRLAEHFLPEEARQQAMNELAQAIQDTVENFLCGRDLKRASFSEEESTKQNAPGVVS